MTTSASAETPVATREETTRGRDELAASMRTTIRKTVRALAAYHDYDAAEMARMFKVSKATAYRKLNGETDFTALELGMLAYAFACNVQDFYTGIRTRPSMQAIRSDEQIFNDPGIADLERRRDRRDAGITGSYLPRTSATVTDLVQVRAGARYAATRVAPTARNQTRELRTAG